MKIALIRCWLFVQITTIALTFSLPVFSQDTTDRLSKALNLVHQVENPTGNPPTDAQRIDLLSQAITAAQAAPNHRLKGHRVLAIQAIRTALAEIRAGDPNHQAAVYLRTADTELSTSLKLAAADQSSQQTQPPPVAATPWLTMKVGISLAPANAPPVPASSTLPPNGLASITQVITRLVANASEKPPGRVEDFVTHDTVETVKALSEMMSDKRSLGDALAYTYGAFSLEGPLTCLYAGRSAAIVFGKVKLTPAALQDHKEHPDVSTVETTVGGKVVSTETGPALMFGPGGSSNFLDDKVAADGEVVASF